MISVILVIGRNATLRGKGTRYNITIFARFRLLRLEGLNHTEIKHSVDVRPVLLELEKIMAYGVPLS